MVKPKNKGNSNFNSNRNLSIGAWNMIFKNIDSKRPHGKRSTEVRITQKIGKERGNS